MEKRLICAFAMSFFFASAVNAEEVVSLSEKAAKLKRGMSRAEVIALLGNPTWASIPGDAGEYRIPMKDFALVLRWKNSPSLPVSVQFNTSYKVTGWDEGRFLCGDKCNEPGEDYSCEKKDRSQFCK